MGLNVVSRHRWVNGARCAAGAMLAEQVAWLMR
jgi:hypothetical protein